MISILAWRSRFARRPRPRWTPEQNKVAADALHAYLGTTNADGSTEQSDHERNHETVTDALGRLGIIDLESPADRDDDRDGGFEVTPESITDLYEAIFQYSSKLVRSRWNVVRRLLGRTCASCRSYRQLEGDTTCRCAWGEAGTKPPWGRPFYPSPQRSCRRWQRRGGR